MANELLYLSRAAVETVGLTMPEVIDLVEQAFVEKGNGRAEMPPKPGIHPQPDSFIHAMPAYLPTVGAAGIKWVSGYPTNPDQGLPQITGLLVLNDPDTGLPLAVMDCTWITEVRTGAASAVAAKYLARADSETIGILGCGVQGGSNLRALKTVLPGLRAGYAYDILLDKSAAYAKEMADLLEMSVTAVETPEKAVQEMDVVVTAGPILKQPHATIKAGWLKEGAFASAVDFDSYWEAAAQAEFDLIATDDLAQFEYYRGIGYFQQTPQPYADLGEIVVGSKPGRSSDEQRTIAMNLGLAIEDMIVAKRIYDLAQERELGDRLPL